MALTVAPDKQLDFVKRGYGLLIEDLHQVDLYQIVMLLVKNQHIVLAITMCIRKAQC